MTCAAPANGGGDAIAAQPLAYEPGLRKYNLAACIKGGLELQATRSARPCASDAAIEAGRAEIKDILANLGALESVRAVR